VGPVEQPLAVLPQRDLQKLNLDHLLLLDSGRENQSAGQQGPVAGVQDLLAGPGLPERLRQDSQAPRNLQEELQAGNHHSLQSFA